jgi:ankyrin repeat protein
MRMLVSVCKETFPKLDERTTEFKSNLVSILHEIQSASQLELLKDSELIPYKTILAQLSNSAYSAIESGKLSYVQEWLKVIPLDWEIALQPNRNIFALLVQHGSLELLQFMIESGIAVAAFGQYADSRLMRAIYANYTKINGYFSDLNVLHKAYDLILAMPGADINKQDEISYDGTILLHVMLSSHLYDRRHNEIIPYLLSRGADPCIISAEGNTVLTSIKQRPEIAVMLLEMMGNRKSEIVNRPDSHGYTPLVNAVFFGLDHPIEHKRLVQVLLDAGADPHMKNENGVSYLEKYLEMFKSYLTPVKREILLKMGVTIPK